MMVGDYRLHKGNAICNEIHQSCTFIEKFFMTSAVSSGFKTMVLKVAKILCI